MTLPHADLATQASLPEDFRAAMGNVASAVAVVTVLAGRTPHGATVSAFLSLSMNPPMLLVSLQHGSRLLAALHPGAIVGVNVLADHQHETADRFAQRSDDKFEGVPWQVRHGAPSLTEHHAWVAMRVTDLISTGDHCLVLGEVTAAQTGSRAPLTYWRRSFGTHHAHSARKGQHT